ncbi:MAG: lysophospholipid acyltransferase family protein [Bacteroidota bacterium]
MSDEEKQAPLEADTVTECPRLGPIAVALGAVRLVSVLLVVALGTVFVLLVGWVRVRGVRLGGWIVMGMAHVTWAIFGVRIRCDEVGRLRSHRGFLFPNHRSYADIAVLLHLFPVRFLSQHKVERMPFIGWLAKAVGTVFVNRESKASRAEARRELAETMAARSHPPLVLFPEGGINRAPGLQPLRRGAFEVAAEGSVPYLLAAIRYSDEAAVRWHEGEPLMQAVWRLARHRGTITADVAILETVHPTSTDEADALVAHAKSVLERALLA